MATIQGVYVALFGRPADPLGLTFFNSVTNNGANLSAIGDLSTQKEYTDRFAGQSNVQIITSIYQSLFNRDPDMAGLTFFVNALNNKTFNINNIAIAILDGAQGTDKTIVDAKIASANAFTAAIDTPIEVGAYSGNTAAAAGRAFLADVTTTPKTAAQADVAVSAVVGAGAAGNTVVLTATDSVVSLTSKVGADFVTTNNNDTINAGVNFTVADKIDGGLGTDTLNASIAVDTAVGVDGLKNVELAFVKATADAKFDVTEAKQLTQVWNDASGASKLTIDGVALTTAVGLKGAISGVTTVNFANAAGTADAVTLAVDASTGAGGVSLVGAETVTVSNTGTSSIGTIGGASLKTVTVTGSGSLTADVAATVETVSNTGAANVTTNLTAVTGIKTYTGGTGKDTVTIDVDSTADLSVNLGAGNDVLTVNKGAGDATKAVTITLGAGNDAVTVGQIANIATAVPDNNTKLLATLVTITDFNTAEDSLKVDLQNSAAANREVLSNTELADIAAAADLFAALQVVVNTTAVGNNAIFSYKGDTYIYDNAAGVGLTTEDALIKLTGVAVTSLTATNFEVI